MRFALVVSDLTVEELADAPERVKSALRSLPPEQVERVSVTQECVVLRDAYLNANVVGRASEDDALHIAIATVMAVDMVVSWNFKHIVHFEKIVGFEGVNTLNNYSSPRIYSPREVIAP